MVIVTFFSKTFLRRHQKECHRGEQRISHQVYNVIPSLEYTYVKEVFTRYHQDAVADICTKDDTLVTIGKYVWAKHKHKKDKVQDCRKIVMRDMRRLAILYKKVQDQEEILGILPHKDGNIGDLFRRRNYTHIIEAINSLSKSAERNKPGLKIGLKYLLISSGKIIRIIHLLNEDLIDGGLSL